MLLKKVLVGLSLSSIVLAASLRVSRDGKCGASTDYQCEGSKYGDCCSRYGYCGRTSAYCDAGCQDDFGSCWSDNRSTSKAGTSSTRTFSTRASSTRTVSSAAASSTLKVSTSARCGTGFGFTCLGSRYGDCCSQYSYCGSTSAYCGQGCQLGYGKCNENPKPSTTTIKSSSTASMTSSITSSATPPPSSSSSATSTTSTVSSSSISSTTTTPPSSPSSSSSSSSTTPSSSTAPAAPVASSVLIQVSGSGGGVIGFLGLTNDQSRYIVVTALQADLFTYNAPPASTTSGLTLLDTDAPASHFFLAGVISPGIELTTSNSNAAILSLAPVSTSAGSAPQSGGSVAIPGSEYETSIFTINAITGSVTAQWVNHAGSTPATFIVYDPVGQTVYLTANPSAVILNHPGSQEVTFQTI